MRKNAHLARRTQNLRRSEPGDSWRGTPLARRVWRARAGLAGGFIIVVAVCSVVIGPLLVTANPIAIDLQHRMLPPFWEPQGSPTHPLGTDHLGRDVLARLLHGGRVSILIGILAVAVAGSSGVLLGLVSGYYGGILDTIIMRLADIQQSFPFVGLGIMIVAVLGLSAQNVIITLGIGGWILFARITRGEALRVREEIYVLAARAIGASDARIIGRHIMPNIASPCIITASFAFSIMVIVEASLSFLGLGVPPPMPSWGMMLYDARNYIELCWWLPTFPGLAIMLTVLGVNMLGDWLRDALDPRLRVL